MDVSAIIAALIMLVGLAGIIIPVLPGLLVVWVGVLVWALLDPTTAGWWLVGITALIVAAGFLLQYLIPGQRMRRAGVRTSTLIVGVLCAVAAAFVIPIIGAPLGFPVGIYLVERVQRGNHDQAWTATVHALRAVGLNILIELSAAMATVVLWVATLVFFV